MSSKHTRNWVLTASQDYEPCKSLSLGQILEDPYQPASALVPEGQIPVPPESLRDHGEKRGVHIQFNDKLAASFAAWSEVNGAPVAARAEGQVNEARQATWDLKSLESSTFLPSVDYVKKVLNSGDVPSKTQWWKLRRRIYMVTGVRIARGAIMMASDVAENRAKLELKADSSSQNVPVKGGVEGDLERGTSRVETAEEISDFVFAYRLNEITYRLWVSHKPITFGETAAAHKDPDEQEDEREAGLDGYDVNGVKGIFTGLDGRPGLVE